MRKWRHREENDMPSHTQILSSKAKTELQVFWIQAYTSHPDLRFKTKQNLSFDPDPWQACTGNSTNFCSTLHFSNFSHSPPPVIFLSSSFSLSLFLSFTYVNMIVLKQPGMWSQTEVNLNASSSTWSLLLNFSWASVPSSAQWGDQYLPQRVTVKIK